MKQFYLRPLNLPKIGDQYWPEGIPSNIENVYSSTYIDEDSNQFEICYTDEQIENQVKQCGGWFHPWIPLGCYGFQSKTIPLITRYS